MSKYEEMRDRFGGRARTVKHKKVVTVEDVRDYPRGTEDEEIVRKICLQCFAGVTDKMVADGGVSLILQLDRAWRKMTDEGWVEIYEIALRKIQDYNMSKRGVVRVVERGVEVFRHVTVAVPVTVTEGVTERTVTGTVTGDAVAGCPQCGRPLKGRQLFCSGACKVKAHRAKSKSGK